MCIHTYCTGSSFVRDSIITDFANNSDFTTALFHEYLLSQDDRDAEICPLKKFHIAAQLPMHKIYILYIGIDAIFNLINKRMSL